MKNNFLILFVVKSVSISVFLVLATSPFLGAQDTCLALSKRLFDGKQQIQLASQEGWKFNPRHEPDWASVKADTEDWIKLRPVDVTTKLEDKSGRIEGWFRLEFCLDPSLDAIPLGISRNLWAATDIYLDGKLVHSFGNTGTPYKAYNPINKYQTPIDLTPGKVHVLAMHFVDYETPTTSRDVKLNPKNLQDFLSITGPEFNKSVERKIKETYVVGTLSMSISCLLFLMFLLLLYLNPTQHIFRLVSFLTFFVFLAAVGKYYGQFKETTYQADKILFIFANGVFLPIMHVMTLIITEWVLKKKTSRITKSILVLMPITSLLGHLFNISAPFGILNAIMLGYFAYLVFTSWKQIGKAEWAVVVGMMALTIGALIFVTLHKYYSNAFYDYENILLTIILLSAPIMLLVYLSLSYKEILAAREAETQKVLQITEEKKALLESQNEMLEAKVTQRTEALEKSLKDLKSTQSQLIQSEKLASLGELTAGIAHEIQNPLNFVNNFSELSMELAEELKEEIKKPEKNWELIEDLTNDLSQNQQKINLHGKRASSIVTGMLQHARTSTGKKEPTDINTLADEYLRLSYHGLRAKDPTFNAKMTGDFDPAVGKLDVIPQDIGRVLLNLINNAFYAVSQKQGALLGDGSLQVDKKYEPTVTVSTKKLGDKVEIRVQDNGTGIPDSVKAKIFQPFFTTKPTGQGTGLGLSLAYDIVTKGHGGELSMETKEGEGTAFIIKLPGAPSA